MGEFAPTQNVAPTVTTAATVAAASTGPGAPVRGREMKSLEVFGKSLAYWDEKAKEGRVHGHHEYFALTGNATQRAGTMVIEK